MSAELRFQVPTVKTLEEWADNRKRAKRAEAKQARRRCSNVGLLAAVCFSGGLLIGSWVEPSTAPANARSGFRLACQEDEVAAPMIDHNPKHGLTWECVSRELFLPEPAGDRVVLGG